VSGPATERKKEEEDLEKKGEEEEDEGRKGKNLSFELVI